MDNNLRTAFILSIVALGSIGVTIISFSRVYDVFIGMFNYGFVSAILMLTLLAGPLVVASIALGYLKNVKDVPNDKKAYYIIAKVFSLVSIITTAVLLGVATIVLAIFDVFRDANIIY